MRGPYPPTSTEMVQGFEANYSMERDTRREYMKEQGRILDSPLNTYYATLCFQATSDLACRKEMLRLTRWQRGQISDKELSVMTRCELIQTSYEATSEFQTFTDG